MKVIPKPGDYVSTVGMTEEQYHAVAKVFMDAGCNIGEYKTINSSAANDFVYLGWRHVLISELYFSDEVDFNADCRELKLSDLLSSEPEHWMPKVGEECEYQSDDAAWHKCQLLAESEFGVVLYYFYSHTASWIYECDKPKFRPIKSDREEAIEELQYLIGCDGIILPDTVTLKVIAERIYDNNFRKIKP